LAARPLLATHDLDERVARAVRAVRERSRLVPRAGIVLGSGLSDVSREMPDAAVCRTAELPHWPPSTVAGHPGRLAIGSWNGVPVAVLAGRSHRYEGYSMDQVTFGVRVLHALGARILIFTNAVGAIHPEYRKADLVLGADHINFIGKRGLFTPGELAERRLGRRVAACYSPRLRARLFAAGARAGVALHVGVLMGSHGPSYETAAEVRMAAALGADLVCMSTVHEALLGAHLGCECASLSCVTNRATGTSPARLDHGEVKEAAVEAAPRIRRVFDEFLKEEAASSPLRGGTIAGRGP